MHSLLTMTGRPECWMSGDFFHPRNCTRQWSVEKDTVSYGRLVAIETFKTTWMNVSGLEQRNQIISISESLDPYIQWPELARVLYSIFVIAKLNTAADRGDLICLVLFMLVFVPCGCM